MELSCPLGTTSCLPPEKFRQKPSNESFVDQICLVKMARYWPRSFFCKFTDLDSVSVHKQKKNLEWPISSQQSFLYIENTTNQKTGKLLYSLQFYTKRSQSSIVHRSLRFTLNVSIKHRIGHCFFLMAWCILVMQRKACVYNKKIQATHGTLQVFLKTGYCNSRGLKLVLFLSLYASEVQSCMCSLYKKNNFFSHFLTPRCIKN